MSEIDILFFDVGGVCLTNGWDADARRAASRHFSLDLEDVEARHHTLVEAFERGDCGLAAITNESRELNHYRIDAFGLGTIFFAFFNSCYLGVPKPNPRIDQLALEVMHAAPSRCLFIDDREENVAGAQAVGIRDPRRPARPTRRRAQRRRHHAGSLATRVSARRRGRRATSSRHRGSIAAECMCALEQARRLAFG